MGRFAQILGVVMLMGGAGLGALGGPYYMLDWGGTLVIAGAVIGSAGVLLTVLGTLIRQVAWLRADIQGLAHFAAGGAFPHPDKDEDAQQIDLPPGSFTPAEAEERTPERTPSPAPEAAPEPVAAPPQPAEPPANLPPAAGLSIAPAAGVAAAGAAGGGLAVVARSILSSVSGPADGAGAAPPSSPPAAAAQDGDPARDREDLAELQADLGGAPEEESPSAGESARASSQEGVIAAYSVGSSSFTMYVDGRIRASMPDGEREFASMDELKTFMAERRVSP